MSNRRRTPGLPQVSLEGVKRAKREAEAERAKKEQARRDATMRARQARRPSFPRVAMEGIARQTRQITKEEEERLFGEGDALSLQTDGHRLLITENITVGAGTAKDGQRPRALATFEIMHARGTIDDEVYAALKLVAHGLDLLQGHSEGVGSYGLSPGGSDPTTKADRRGCGLSGYSIDWQTGNVSTTPEAQRSARRNASLRHDVAMMVYAAAGVEDTEGRRNFDQREALIFLSAVKRTNKPPTLDQIGSLITRYGKHSKQKPAGAAGYLCAMFARVARHLGFKKVDAWDESLKWVPRD